MFCLALVLPFAGASSTEAAIHHVKADAPGPVRDGTTWASAYTNVAAALQAAQPGDEVWVAAGEYPQVLTLPPGRDLYGGFAGTETARGQRDPARYTTTLRGVQQGSGIVTVALGAGRDTVLDGFTLTAGRGLPIGPAEAPLVCGRAVYCGDASPTISGNVFHHNEARGWEEWVQVDPWYGYYEFYGTGFGGAIYSRNASPRITGITFTHNGADDQGGAVFCEGGAPVLMGNTFELNTSKRNMQEDGAGGAVACKGGDARVEYNVFRLNRGMRGGALYANGGVILRNPFIANSVFRGNSASETTLQTRLGSLDLVNNLFAGNAGGVHVWSGDVWNNTIVGNEIPTGGTTP